MNIIVLIKQVPDMERVKFDRERGVIDRKSAGTEINPFDLNALETAVKIGEEIGASVTALSMGPPKAEEALKEAIARGAQDGILLSDRAFGGSDVKATSITLANGIKEIGDYDLVIAGMQTVDGDTGQVGPEVAGYLDIPHVCYVEGIKEINDKEMIVATNLWDGTYLKKVKFPALITVTKDINVPRMPTFKNKMKARKAEIKVLGVDDIKIAKEEVGLKGSATKVKKIEVPPAVKREGKIWRENYSKAEDEIISIIKQKKILEG